jgi:hypothetical protein
MESPLRGIAMLAFPPRGAILRDVIFFEEEMKDMIHFLQRFCHISDRFAAMQNLVSSRVCITLIILSIECKTDAPNGNMKDVRCEMKDAVDVIGVLH